MRLAIPTIILAVVLVLGWRVCSGGDRDHLQLTETDLPAELRQTPESDPGDPTPANTQSEIAAVARAAQADGVAAADPAGVRAPEPGAAAKTEDASRGGDRDPTAAAALEVELPRAEGIERRADTQVARAAAPAAAKPPAEPPRKIEPTLPAVSAPERGPADRVYVVQPGDWLMQIAREQFGDPGRAAEIARLNNLSDADRLRPGQELVLP